MTVKNLLTYGWMGLEEEDKASLCSCFESLETLVSFQGQRALKGTIVKAKELATTEHSAILQVRG